MAHLQAMTHKHREGCQERQGSLVGCLDKQDKFLEGMIGKARTPEVSQAGRVASAEQNKVIRDQDAAYDIAQH